MSEPCQHYIIAEYLRIDLDQRFACTRCGELLRLAPESLVQRLAEALRGWANHKPNCSYIETMPIGTAIPARVLRTCNCGLSAILAEIEEASR